MIRTDLATALSLLTRLPVGWLGADWAAMNPGRAVWAYPLVGAVVGGIGALVFAACRALGLSPALAALWTMAALLLTTGGLHEDGLADTADGFGGGRTRDRKLEIMRDSRIGSYGALALMLSLGLRAAALAALPSPRAAAAALIAAGVLGRAAMLLPLRLLPPARPGGLGARVAGGPGWSVVAAVALTVAGVVMLLPLRSAVPAIAVGLIGAGALSRMARRQIGGVTGDVLGAVAVSVECLVLTVYTVLGS
jgi:adenosylcobinamide-GDP ribazoletransferase